MEYTENYDLKKPEGTDIYDIKNENDNMDIIDTQLNGHAVSISGLNTNKAEKSAVANKTDLARINITSGTTNDTGSTITNGTYFYYNGTFVRAKADIANGATLTLNTNYEVVPIGDELTSLKSSLTDELQLSNQATGAGFQVTADGDFFAIRIYKSSGRNLTKDLVMLEWNKTNHQIVITNIDSTGNIISRDKVTTTPVI